MPTHGRPPANPSPAGDLAFGYPAKYQMNAEGRKPFQHLCCVQLARRRAAGSLATIAPFSYGPNATKSAGLSKADQRAL
jgi:hypothetical protein